MDLDGDRESGAVTVVLVHGTRRVLAPVAALGAVASLAFCIALLVSEYERSTIDAATIVVLGAACTVALAWSARMVAADDEPPSWYAVRQAFYLLVILGLAQTIALNRGALLALVFSLPVVAREASGYLRTRRRLMAGRNAW